MKRYLEFLAKYMPEANKADSMLGFGYLSAQALVQVLKQRGDELTRDNVMKQAASLKGASSDLLIPGNEMNTSSQDFGPLVRKTKLAWARLNFIREQQTEPQADKRRGRPLVPPPETCRGSQLRSSRSFRARSYFGRWKVSVLWSAVTRHRVVLGHLEMC
jgi:hypothetical protein